MNIKKIIAAMTALAICGAMLTACGGNKDTGDNANTTASETTAAENTEAANDPGAADETPADDGASDVEPDDSSDGDELVSDNPLKPLADAAMSAGDGWPMLWEVTDPQMMEDFFLLDMNNANYRNIMVLQCPMSAIMTEIIIIEADDVSSARSDLEARQKKAQELDAFYPNDQALADASIVGAEGNYAYFILADQASEAETALVEAIKAL